MQLSLGWSAKRRAGVAIGLERADEAQRDYVFAIVDANTLCTLRLILYCFGARLTQEVMRHPTVSATRDNCT